MKLLNPWANLAAPGYGNAGGARPDWGEILGNEMVFFKGIFVWTQDNDDGFGNTGGARHDWGGNLRKPSSKEIQTFAGTLRKGY